MPNWKKLITSGSNISQLNNDSNFISSFTNTQNQYSTSVVSSSGIKLRLSGTGHNGNTTDDVKFAAGSNVSIVRTDASTITISSTDTNTDTVDMGDGFKVANSSGDDQFTVTENEEIRFEGSGATSVSFDSSTQKVTISSTDTNTDTNTQLSTEEVQDIVGAMVSGNTETNIAVTYDDSNGKLNFASTDTNTQATRGTLGIDTDDDVTFDDITAGSTSKGANTVIKALAGDSYEAGFEAYGSSQGTGYLYVGQSSTYGGGIAYNGDGSPAFAGGETSDAITFFRRSNGTDTEVFHYSYNADTVNFNGDIVAYHSSDKRLKTNILPIESALDKIDKLGGYTFDWVPTEEVHSNEGTDIGVIAQEIEEQFPELVTTRENGYKAVKYDKLVAVLLQGIKELRQEIRDCKASK
jgi:hypothetical protein